MGTYIIRDVQDFLIERWGQKQMRSDVDLQLAAHAKQVRLENAQLREQNRVWRGLVVYVEQIEADLHAALNGTRHDPSWIRPIQLSRNERQELYLGCLKQLQALKAALTATSQEGRG